MVPYFLHQGFAECVESRFRGTVGGPIRKRVVSRQAADIDNPPAAARAEMRQRRTAAVKNAGQVGIEDFLPFVDGHVANGTKHTYAGVVDQHVDAPEMPHGDVESL